MNKKEIFIPQIGEVVSFSGKLEKYVVLIRKLYFSGFPFDSVLPLLYVLNKDFVQDSIAINKSFYYNNMIRVTQNTSGMWHSAKFNFSKYSECFNNFTLDLFNNDEFFWKFFDTYEYDFDNFIKYEDEEYCIRTSLIEISKK